MLAATLGGGGTSARDRILSGLPDPTADPLCGPYLEADENQENVQLWEKFRQRFEALGGIVVDWPQLAAVEGRQWVVERDLVVPECAGPHETSDVWRADLGLERGAFAIAETGTVVLDHSAGNRRLTSLAPLLDIVVVRERDIVATLVDAFKRVPQGNMALVTGPSRTADIEGVLVRGVHGPKAVWVLIEPNTPGSNSQE